MYGLRDVTGTIESIPFITSRILTKTLAEGTDGLCLDINCGNGSFVKKKK